jgi:SAM-dependent methyltransferase
MSVSAVGAAPHTDRDGRAPGSGITRHQEAWEKIFEEEPYSIEDLLGADKHVGVVSSPYLPFVVNSLSSDDRILEAGCGRAQWVLYLHNSGVEIVGVDFAVRAMRRTKQLHGQLPLVGGDMNSLCFRSGCFDKILCWSVVDHIEAGPLAAIKEMHRVLKQHGTLFITVPCKNLLDQWFYPVVRLKDRLRRSRLLRTLFSKAEYRFEFFQQEFSRKQLSALLIASGFRLKNLQPFSREMGFARSVNRLLLKDSKLFFKNKAGPWDGLSRLGCILCRLGRAISPWMTADEIFAVAVKK